MRLPDTVVLITGAGSGIGRATALRSAAEGARVVVVDRDQDAATRTADEVRSAGGLALPIVADVTGEAAVAAIFSRAITEMGRIDVLVNNVGVSLGTDILDLDLATWERNVSVVLTSAYLCIRATLPGMVARGRGAIVNISSVNGMTGLGEDAYGAAKAGMINLTQNVAVRYGPRGIRANCTAPGTVRTPVWDTRRGQDPEIFERLTRWYPLGRIGDPDDIARAVVFLASDDAAWVTGVVLPVDGGLMAGRFDMARDLVPDQS